MIEEKRGRYSVTRLCHALNVSLSSYYAWRKRDICDVSETVMTND